MIEVSVIAFMIATVLAGCGSDKHSAVDAVPPEDAVADAAPDAIPDGMPDAMPDAPPALDCPTYCAEIQANCTDVNAQYGDMAHCLATCRSFNSEIGSVTDTSGNTLGCRIYHAGAPAIVAPTTHCTHAGPGGDSITATPPAFCSGGDVCQSFCALEIDACGTLDTPLPGDPKDPANKSLYQYRNVDDCMKQCAKYDKTHAYSTSATGDSLACRLYNATKAALSVMPDAVMYCTYTGLLARGPCDGLPMP